MKNKNKQILTELIIMGIICIFVVYGLLKLQSNEAKHECNIVGYYNYNGEDTTKSDAISYCKKMLNIK